MKAQVFDVKVLHHKILHLFVESRLESFMNSFERKKVVVFKVQNLCLNSKRKMSEFFLCFFKENSFAVKSSFFLFLIASTVCTLAYDKNPLLNLSQINDCLHGLILCS